MKRLAPEAFTKLEDEVLAHFFAINPRYAVQLGLHEYDGLLPDFSRASVAKWTKKAGKLLDSLRNVNASSWDRRRRLDKELLTIMIERLLFDLIDLRALKKYPNNYIIQLNVNPYIIRNYAPLDRRIASATAHLKSVPRFLATARENLSPSLPEPHLKVATEASKGLLKHLKEDAVKAASSASENVRREFLDALWVTVREIESFVSLLQEYKNKADPNFALGRELYQKMLWVEERVSTPVEKLLEMGLTDLERNKESFTEVARGGWPGKSPKEVIELLGSEHPTAENLLSETQNMLENIRSFLIQGDVITIPSEGRCKVVETPPFARVTTTAAMSSPGTFETVSKEAFYYVTPVDAEWSKEKQEEWLGHLNYSALRDVSVHEAYPGHFTHFLHRRRLKTKTGKAFVSTAFNEGWAHYTEQMMLEVGYMATDRKQKIAQLQEALLRDCRFIVSNRMHTQGMSLEEATRFLMDNAFIQRLPAEREALRGTVGPGYLYYTLGKLTILDVRNEYFRRKPGGKLKQFHDELLALGSPPIGLLAKYLLHD